MYKLIRSIVFASLVLSCSESLSNGYEALSKQSSNLDCSSKKQVYAFYYAWYAPKVHGGWKGAEVTHGDHPSFNGGSGYDSLDETKIAADISVAKSVGIDGFIVAWIGNHPQDAPKDKPNQVLAKMLRLAKDSNFCVSALFEAQIIANQYRLDVKRQMNDLSNILSAYPDNTFKIQDKPAIFIWKNEIVNANTWANIMRSGNIYLVGDAGPRGQGINATKNQSLSNTYYYSTWWNGSLNAMASMWGSLTSKPKFATVSPGFRPPHANCPGHSACYGRWRNSGDQVYKQQWEHALSNQADYVLITSYNEWPEGHYIEESRKFGTHYLNLTGNFVNRFKSVP